MARIILDIVGPWRNAPELPGPFTYEFQDGFDRDLASDFTALAAGTEALTDAEIGGVRGHNGVLLAQYTFEDAGTRDAARLTVSILKAAVAAGATAALVSPTMRVFGASSIGDIDEVDGASLFHLFVNLLVESEEVVSEGMQVFDRADVVVPSRGDDETARGAAQAAAFALSAQMVCDRFRPTVGSVFRASESAPFFNIGHQMAVSDSDDPFVNPRGQYVLKRR